MSDKKLKQNFTIYFHDNFCDNNPENWNLESYIKSGEFETYKSVVSFVEKYILNKSKIINIHQYRICFFAGNNTPVLESYEGKINEDFGEFRIAIKFGMVYNVLSEDLKWDPRIFWTTYENIPEIIKQMIFLFIQLDLTEFKLAGLSFIMKQDVAEFRWLVSDKDKVEEVKKLLKGFMNYLVSLRLCPKTVKCYDFHHNLITL